MQNFYRVQFLLEVFNHVSTVIILIQLFSPVTYATKHEPVNIGFIFSLPWDISNTLRAPLAGPISILLSSGLAIILIIGMVFSPVWYFFGFPKRNYHLHDKPALLSGPKLKEARNFLGDFQPDSESLYNILQGNFSFLEQIKKKELGESDIGQSSTMINEEKGRMNDERINPLNNGTDLSFGYPDFIESIFLFVPNIKEDCRKLMICHAHGFLKYLPASWLRVYHFFSKKLLSIPEAYKTAILTGITDQSNCMEIYQECNQDIVTLAKSTLFYNVPEDFRTLWKLEM